MLTMLGSPRRCCDGITRRETFKTGALSALGGFGLPQMLGGAATQHMCDLKPEAPAEVRGEFKPIATSVPGFVLESGQR